MALVAAVAITASTMLPVLLVGTLSVFVRNELALSKTSLGVAVAAFFGASAVLSLASGRTEGVDARWLLAGGALSSTISMMAIALLAHSLVALVAFLVIGSFGAAVATPCTNRLVADHVDGRRQGLAHGVKQAAIPLALLLAGLAVPAATSYFSWRWAFAIGSFLAMAAVVPVAALGRVDPDVTAPVEVSRSGRPSPVGLALLTAGAALAAGAITSLNGFLTAGAASSHVSVRAAGLLLSAGSAVVIVARVAGGAAADRLHDRQLMVVAGMLLVSASGYVLLASLGATAFKVGALLGLVSGWGWTGLFTYAVVRHNPHAPATATGYAMAGIYVGGVGGPLAFGAIVDAAGYRAGWWFAAALAAAASIVFLAAFVAFEAEGKPVMEQVTGKSAIWEPDVLKEELT